MSTITKTDRETRCVAGELRAVKAADGKVTTIRGYAAVYEQKSLPIYGAFYEIVKRGAFARALAGEDDVRALVDHDSSMIIGRNKSNTLRLSDDSKGLAVEIDLPDTSVARDLAVSIERGDITQMSFGFRTISDKWRTERTADGIMVDVRELIEVELFDVSPVAFPAYPQTEVGMRSREAWRKKGFPITTRLNEARVKLAERES